MTAPALGLLAALLSAHLHGAAPAVPAAPAAVRPPASAPARNVDRAPAPTRTALPARSGSGRRVVYAKRAQQVWLVDAKGTVVRTYLVSGQASQPRPGTYRVYSRSPLAHSAVSSATMRRMVRFTHGIHTGAAIGFHEIPRDRRGRPEQRLAQLGRPLSAGCIREAPADALALWNFAGVGTRVVVVA
ncbi:lipoprotein-anchoring transpeptidase ErfK/SrfK [Motilibacter peucedani]|uniref:Lipoprotein-anchoring transpeptidase ErfK/SrfK n=1 Tax=Motilibacter peucedani TaxID=598650 RepID=A0A420XUD7_9ACTN|nr:L,D-transpeptidase [Motilibacter peucedani]RKS80444.1 lipoprotein-anchoring transpeptidase ErfK/SrfK [Motilibacter peucedani]